MEQRAYLRINPDKSQSIVNAIPYDKSMRIANTEQLAHGTGALFLEVMTSHTGDYIAVQWRRNARHAIPYDHQLIQFA